MKIITDNMGNYRKVAGKELDGVMSLEMFGFWSDGNEKIKSVGVITSGQLFNAYQSSEDYRRMKDGFEEKKLEAFLNR